MAPEEATLQRGVDVQFLIRVGVMMAMMSRPPDRPALHCSRAQQRENELAGARSLERTVRKVAVIKASDGEHAHHVQQRHGQYCYRADPDHEHQQAQYMQGKVG